MVCYKQTEMVCCLDTDPYSLGKFHFKIYMLCCTMTNLVFKVKIHTKVEGDQHEGEDNDYNMLSKTDQLTLAMCADLEGTGATVNMGN